MSETLYRRPLPAAAIEFSSPEGRQLFAEALATRGLDGYFPLAEQFHTQADPMFCGLGSLVMALNALAIDPGRLWKGPWRWFSEELLDCCVPLEEVRKRGLDLDELACLARCNGAEVELHRGSVAELRHALTVAARGEAVVIVAYDRSALEQTGTGHFSPVGGYHAARDLVLMLDVARFKYPPHWVATQKLWHATQPIDAATGKPRGWLVLRRRRAGLALGFTLRCVGEDVKELARRLDAVAQMRGTMTLEMMARELVPLTHHLELRAPTSQAHRDAVTRIRAAVREVPMFEAVRAEVGEERAEAVTMLMLLATSSDGGERLQHELESLRVQLKALLAEE